MGFIPKNWYDPFIISYKSFNSDDNSSTTYNMEVSKARGSWVPDKFGPNKVILFQNKKFYHVY